MATTHNTAETQASLIKISDTDLTVSNPHEDVRGNKVIDSKGEDIGKVSDLMIDDREQKVRFLEVSGGGFLGIGDRTVMVPVDSITKIHDEHLHIDQTVEHVASGPDYDPGLAADQGYWGGYYGHYGIAPFWAPGYTYPGSYPDNPYRPR